MLNWFEIRYNLPKEYMHLSEYGYELEKVTDEFVHTISTPTETALRNGIFVNYIDIPKLASLKVLIDSLLMRILQQLVMITSGSEEGVRKRLIEDLQNFRKWVATYEKDMKFGDMRERVEFVNYISILKSFLESYFYDALMHHIRTKQPLAEVLIARAGIIVEPVSWAKEMMKMGERIEPKG